MTIATNHALSDKNLSNVGCMRVVNEPAVVIRLVQVLNPEDLFIDFYEKYYERLKVRLRCEDADDIVQETFKKLWIKRNDLALIIHPEHYLFTIARNIFLKSKINVNRSKSIMKDFMSGHPDYCNITEEEIFYKDTRRMLDDRMQRLPSRLRQTYTLKKQGYKLKEIERLLDIKEQTVKNFLQKAEKKMEGFLEEINCR